MSVTQYIESFQLPMRYLTLVLSHVLDIAYTFFPVSTRQFRSLGCLLLSQLGGPSSSSKKHTQSPVLGHHSFEETLLAPKKRYTISGFLPLLEDIGKQKNKTKIKVIDATERSLGSQYNCWHFHKDSIQIPTGTCANSKLED